MQGSRTTRQPRSGTGLNIAQKGVVYVTFNYRVGIFGFLAYKDSTGKEVKGNFAIQDEIAALKWVHKNIRAFGGDPRNVTIAGQSAGAANIQTLIASPAVAGLFKRAVVMSGNSITSTRRPWHGRSRRRRPTLGSTPSTIFGQ